VAEREHRSGDSAAAGRAQGGEASAATPGKSTRVEQAHAVQRQASGAAADANTEPGGSAAAASTSMPRIQLSGGAAASSGASAAAPAPAPAASGRHEDTEFGEYWVVPDGTNRSLVDAIGEQITETAFAAAKTSWDKVKDGSGRIKVTEADSAGTAHAGFKASITAKIGLLMSKPVGRELVASLLTGGFDVTIRPSVAKVYGGGQAYRGGAGTLQNADGSAGAGGTTAIEIDPAVTDNDIKVYNAAGAEISDPVYIFLGHEMIHARHNQLGRNRRNLTAADATKYGNREEEETIATGAGITENQLRSEHGLEARVGHAGVDKRP
jgi:hypothetical protein